MNVPDKDFRMLALDAIITWMEAVLARDPDFFKHIVYKLLHVGGSITEPHELRALMSGQKEI